MGAIFGCVIIFIVVMLFEMCGVYVAWNWLLQPILEIGRPITFFWESFLIALALSIIGGFFFRGSSSD